MEENANTLHFECTDFNSSMHVTVCSVYLCVNRVFQIFKPEGIVIFFDKRWVALKRAVNSMVAFGGSDKSQLVTASAQGDVPLLRRRLVVVIYIYMCQLQDEGKHYP